MPVEVIRGEGPIVLGMPHTGLHVPERIASELNATGLALADTDWAIDRLYHGLHPRATIVRATFHRYVIDANRDPSGASLYPGKNTTGLCPTTTFDGEPIYRAGREPGPEEVEQRLRDFHVPYHAALLAELERVLDHYGVALLYDCHSIRSRIPYLFEGALPDLNIGTNDGAACAVELQTAAYEICSTATQYSSVLNGRFKGGWTTRHYGRPAAHIHAIQMELAQATYMDEAPPWTYRPKRAHDLRLVLGELLVKLEACLLGDLP